MNSLPQIRREIRETVWLAAPIIGGQVGQILLGVTDSIMVGRVGVVPLGAVAFAGNLFSLLFVFGVGLLASVSILVARAHGARRPDDCRDILRHSLVIALVLGCGLALIVCFGLDGLSYFGQPRAVVAEARGYLPILAWSLVPVFLFQCLKQYSEALSTPWAPMVILAGGLVLNVFLNWVLIYGHLGFPALGLRGAGWATLGSRIVVLLILLLHMRSRGVSIGLRGGLRFSRRWFGELLKIGLPVSGQTLFEAGAFASASVMMGWIGVDALAAHQVALSCAATSFMFPLGLSFAVSIRIGQAAGAGSQDRLRLIGFSGIGVAVAGMSLSALLFIAGGRLVASGFVSDPAVIALAARLLVVAGIFQVFDGMQVVSIGALRGLTDVRLPTLITFLAYWVVALPGGYVAGFVFDGGAVGIWGGLASGLAVSAILLLLRFRMKTAGKPRLRRDRLD